MSHVLVKLTNRDDIVGVLDSENDNAVIIKDPMILVIKQDDNDETGAILINYIPFSSQNYVALNKTNIISIINLSEDMVKYYFASRIYCYKTFDKNFTANLRRSTEYLENYINQRTRKKPNLNEETIKFYMSQPASNTVN
jgi:hypothetical protein